MSVPVLVLVSALSVVPLSSALLELTLRATDATPENIILYERPLESTVDLATIILTEMGISDSWPTVNQVTGGVEWYQDGVKFVGSASLGAAIFPVVGNVDSGILYGPTGADYSGTLQQPAASNVKASISYGAAGTEFTGTYDPTLDDVYPVVGDVRNGISYGPTGSDFTGTLVPGGGGGGSSKKIAHRVMAYTPQ